MENSRLQAVYTWEAQISARLDVKNYIRPANLCGCDPNHQRSIHSCAGSQGFSWLRDDFDYPKILL